MAKDADRDTIIILGDWFIDENWLVTRQQRYSSTDVGGTHYLSKHSVVSQRMTTLCGAPAVLAILKSYFDKAEPVLYKAEPVLYETEPVLYETEPVLYETEPVLYETEPVLYETEPVLDKAEPVLDKAEPVYSFISYGVWNKADQRILKCVLCEEQPEGKQMLLTPLTVDIFPYFTDVNEETMCYLKKDHRCKYGDLGLHNVSADPKNAATARIVRCYEGHGGAEPRLLRRYDWERPVETSLKEDMFDDAEPEKVKAVIVVDNGRRVVNPELIGALVKHLKGHLPEINWYIRSKIDHPEWMSKLFKDVKVRLHVIHHKLAQHWQGQRRWRFGEELSRASLEVLGRLTGSEWYEHGEPVEQEGVYRLKSQRAAVILDDNTVIAKDGEQCYNLHYEQRRKQRINRGRSTVFFSALVAQDLDPDWGKDQIGFGTHCANALLIAHDRTVRISTSWNEENPYFPGSYSKALSGVLDKSASKTVTGPPDVTNGLDTANKYSDIWARWYESSQEKGLLESGEKQGPPESDKKQVLQVWRAKGALEEFICVGGRKRDAVNDLLRKIHEFKEENNPKRSFNCLLVASPGWGKSYLAERMANHFDMIYRTFSLSQMASTADLVDCLDTICSVQNTTHRKLLIFMDEINCEIAGHPAMGLLLSPIWDGSFLRNGKTYRLSPAVWVFASTDPIPKLLISNKGSDFVSRLNGPMIELDELSLNVASTKNLRSAITAVRKELRVGGEPPAWTDLPEPEDVFTHAVRKLLSPMKDRGSEISWHSIDAGTIVSGLIEAVKRRLIEDPSTSIYNDDCYEAFDKLKGPFRTEQVYLGISLLINRWGPINRVEDLVLELFYKLMPVNGIRSLEFFVSRFENIKAGQVRCSNVPSIETLKALRRHVILEEKWTDEKKRPVREDEADKLVRIEPDAMLTQPSWEAIAVGFRVPGTSPGDTILNSSVALGRRVT